MVIPVFCEYFLFNSVIIEKSSENGTIFLNYKSERNIT